MDPTTDGTRQSTSDVQGMTEGEHDCTQDSRSSTSRDITSTSRDGRRSEIWNHFERNLVDGVLKSICNYCQKPLGGNPKHGTRHLHDHKKICPALVSEGIRRHVSTKEAMKFSFNQDDARRALVDMIIMHDYPLNIVEHSGFRNYSTILQPLFKCPSRNTVKGDIIKLYKAEKIKVMDMFEKLDSWVAITTDMWTASNQTKGYMAITAHYIDENWILQNKIIRFVYVPCPHTSEVISDVLMTCLMDWNVDTKLAAVTLDNCSANDLMIRMVKDKLLPNSMILSGKYLHMRCCAHILNLIVKDGLTVIKSGIEKIRDSVAYWTATPSRVEKFDEAVKQLKICSAKSLSLDCPTRWNSTFLMLETALIYKDAFYRLAQRDTKYVTLPSDTEWQFCADICEKLRLFYNVSELFSGKNYPTSNLYFLNICQIRLALISWITSSNGVISKMASNMLAKFQKYWEDIHVLMGVCIILDPRYKLEIIEYFFSRIYGNESDRHVERLRGVCYEMYHEFQSRTKVLDELDGDSIVSSPLNSSQEFDNDMLGFKAFVKKQKRMESSLKSELDKCLEAGLVKMKKGF